MQAPAGQIAESVAPIEGETVIVKNYPSAFEKTALDAELKKLGVNRRQLERDTEQDHQHETGDQDQPPCKLQKPARPRPVLVIVPGRQTAKRIFLQSERGERGQHQHRGDGDVVVVEVGNTQRAGPRGCW